MERASPFRAGSPASPDDLLAQARAGDADAFTTLTDPHRRALERYCYRILGSLQDAEDVVQETLLAAWRGVDSFEGRSSIRAWLYRIATNRCLNALRDDRGRAGAAAPLAGAFPRPTGSMEPLHLEPYPDSLLDRVADDAPGPEARYEEAEAVSLAFVAGLQRLPARQRAVLVLRDVLGFRAIEVAELLATTDAAVQSSLQRARAAIDARPRAGASLPTAAVERTLVGRFAEALEAGDVDGVVAVLSEDARLTMPPQPVAFEGPAAIAGFFRALPWWGPGGIRLLPTRANGQPALAYYLDDGAEPGATLGGILVVALDGAGISAVTRFGRDRLHPAFALPATFPA